MQEYTNKEIIQAGRKALDWQPLFAAFKEAFEWALDVAAEFARDYPDEVAAVERVRMAIRSRIAGSLSEINLDPMSVDDVLFTLGLLIGVIERDGGLDGQFGKVLEQVAVMKPLFSEIDQHCFELLAGTYETVQARLRATA